MAPSVLSLTEVKPFALERADQFRVPPPPRLDSADYAAAYNEVKTLGGDGLVDSHHAQGGANADRNLLGLRRHVELVRAAAALQSDRHADRAQDGHG